MARIYSHRNGRTAKKAKPMEAMYAAVVSIVSLVIFGIILAISVASSGESSRWLGGFGGLGLCTAIGAFIYNIGQMKMDTDLKDKIICMSVSSAALIIWAVTIVLGLIN